MSPRSLPCIANTFNLALRHLCTCWAKAGSSARCRYGPPPRACSNVGCVAIHAHPSNRYSPGAPGTRSPVSAWLAVGLIFPSAPGSHAARAPNGSCRSVHPRRVTTLAEGTVQGLTLSSLLGNAYLHYVVDLWFAEEVKPHLRGKGILVRYADDGVFGFERQVDAQRVMAVLGKRLARWTATASPLTIPIRIRLRR